MNKTDRKNVFYITHKIELLLWLILVLFIVALLSVSYMHNEKINNDFTLFLPDIDGLIVGSPVRMMGIEIGHVTKIKPVYDGVSVKFLITQKGIKIPQGTIATVEFSGMAGSKSLELYPPDEKAYISSSSHHIEVSSPKRLHDALGLLSEMYDRIGSIITTCSILSKNLTEIDMPKQTQSKDLTYFLQYLDKTIDNSIKRTKEFEKRILNNGN